MALLPLRRLFTNNLKKYGALTPLRNLTSKQLVYSEFGEPLNVVKFKEVEIPKLGPQDVLVRMLAAPINPADINTIQGRSPLLPTLPSIPGDEGVGEVVEVGSLVNRVEPGERVVIVSRNLGTWRHYGVFSETHLHVISPNLPLAEASMLAIAPRTAYRMLKDYRHLEPRQSVIQTGANSAVGQCVVQLCKLWGINTFNIVASHVGYDEVKKYLLKLGATEVYTLEEAEELTSFDTSISRPVLGLNCLGGRYEDVMLRLMEKCGSLVYYGSAYCAPFSKQFLRNDLSFHRFHIAEYDAIACKIDQGIMMNYLISMMVIGKIVAPLYKSLELNKYTHAFRNSKDCEAFSTTNYVFDLTMPA